MVRQRLDQSRPTPHSWPTSGQSHWGGLVTSHCERRSSFLGRVVVAHVQGSPKGGDALGSLGVTSTRLCPVPPFYGEAGLYRGHFSIANLPVLLLLEPLLHWTGDRA